MSSRRKTKPVVFVSSSVYGREPLLKQICATLDGFGYVAWNSHVGSIPVDPYLSAYESCMLAVDRCDIFLGLISPYYGSGSDGFGGNTITHRELSRAIELEKPRYMLAHEHVVNARRFLLDLTYDKARRAAELKLRKGASFIDDLRLIDMYEEATFDHIQVVERKGNWVQKYTTDAEALKFVESQFQPLKDMKARVDDWRKRNGTVK